MDLLIRILDAFYKGLGILSKIAASLGKLRAGCTRRWKAIRGKEQIFVAALGIASAIAVFTVTRGMGPISFVVSITSGLLIALLSQLLLEEAKGATASETVEATSSGRLLLYILLACLLIALVLSIKMGPQRGFRIAFGSLLILFLPGFALAELFFEKREIDAIERIALSFALSIAAVPLAMFYLNYLAGMKINRTNVVLTVSEIIIISLVIKILRRMFSSKRRV